MLWLSAQASFYICICVSMCVRYSRCLCEVELTHSGAFTVHVSLCRRRLLHFFKFKRSVFRCKNHSLTNIYNVQDKNAFSVIYFLRCKYTLCRCQRYIFIGNVRLICMFSKWKQLHMRLIWVYTFCGHDFFVCLFFFLKLRRARHDRLMCVRIQIYANRNIPMRAHLLMSARCQPWQVQCR